MTRRNKIRGLGLYEIEEYIVAQVAARMFEGNESQAIRFMIREFPKNNPILDDGAPLGILQPSRPAQPSGNSTGDPIPLLQTTPPRRE